MLFDANGRRIRKPRLFGYGRTPASDPDAPRLDPARSGSCADCIGFAYIEPDPEEIPDEVTQGAPDEID